MESLRDIVNENIYCYIMEDEEIDVGFPIDETTDFTSYLTLDEKEDIFEYATDFLFHADFYFDNKYDWNTVYEFIHELRQHNIITDDHMNVIKEYWDDAQEMIKKNRQLHEQREMIYDDLIEELQTRISELCIPDIKCGETMQEFKRLIDYADSTKDMELVTKLKDISDYIITVCQQEGFTNLLCSISSLHVTHTYNKLVEITVKNGMIDYLYEIKDMDAKNITDIIMEYSKAY